MVENGLTNWVTYIFAPIDATFTNEEVNTTFNYEAMIFIESLLNNLITYRSVDPISEFLNKDIHAAVTYLLDCVLTNLASEITNQPEAIQHLFYDEQHIVVAMLREYLTQVYLKIIVHLPRIVSDPYSINFTDYRVSAGPDKFVIRFAVHRSGAI